MENMKWNLRGGEEEFLKRGGRDGEMKEDVGWKNSKLLTCLTS